MRNAILRELMTEYEQLRAANTREELRRREEVSRRCPEIAAILEQRQQLIFQGVRNVLDGQGSAENLPQQMEVLTARLEHLLQENGYPATYLDPVYRCARCKDTGYVGETVRDMCDCMKSRYYARWAYRKRVRNPSKRITKTCSPRTCCLISASASGNAWLCFGISARNMRIPIPIRPRRTCCLRGPAAWGKPS